jgi:hypothetical protein
MKLIREGMEDYEYLVQAAKKDPAKAHQIASTLFPHPWDTHKPAADIEKARDTLFALLDSPSSGSAGGASGSGGTAAAGGAGGSAAGGSGGIDGGAAAGGGGGSAGGSGASSGSNSGGCGCRAAGNPLRGDVWWALFPIAWGVVRRRRARRRAH